MRHLIFLLALVSCSKAHDYETKVMLKNVEVVARDAKNEPLIIEVNVEYPDCPGEQLETLQGNAEFSKCVLKYKMGETVPAVIEYAAMDFGHYDSEITKLGDCVRKRDPRDARSYEVIQECTDVNVNGAKAGFHCSRKPDKELLAKCPWFARQ